jgi:hypothetical protein
MLEALAHWFEQGNGRRRDGCRADPTMPHLERPPEGVSLARVRARGAQPVDAELARRGGEIQSAKGVLRYRAGQHYVVTYANGGQAPVNRNIFDRTYRRRSDGRYEKRTDLVFHYFTLPYAVIVETPEGACRAEPGDWIMQGVMGELYPIPADEGEEKYQPA